jgi:hypothetical protein
MYSERVALSGVGGHRRSLSLAWMADRPPTQIVCCSSAFRPGPRRSCGLRLGITVETTENREG